MSTGKPKLISSVAGGIGYCCGFLPAAHEIFLSAHDGFLYVGSNDPFPESGGATMTIFSSHQGRLTFYANVIFGATNFPGAGIDNPLSVQVDAENRYAYVTYNSAENNPQYGSCTATQCLAIYDISHVRQQATVAPVAGVLISTLPNPGDVLAGHN